MNFRLVQGISNDGVTKLDRLLKVSLVEEMLGPFVGRPALLASQDRRH
jgi:hypothetical protein